MGKSSSKEAAGSADPPAPSRVSTVAPTSFTIHPDTRVQKEMLSLSLPLSYPHSTEQTCLSSSPFPPAHDHRLLAGVLRKRGALCSQLLLRK